jgi:hypothetical protein
MLRLTTAALGASCLFFFLTTSAHASESAEPTASPASPASPTSADPAASTASTGWPADEQPAAPPATPHDDLLLTASAGAFGGASSAGGVVVGLTVLRQKGLLGYGALFEAGTLLFDYETMTAAPMVGVFLDGPRSLRLGVAATGGLHTYSGVGKGFLSSDPGASGAAPFVGARLLAGAELGGKARFHIGALLGLDDDLTRTSKTYAFTESSWTSLVTPHAATATHRIGDLRATAMLTLGTAFDL